MELHLKKMKPIKKATERKTIMKDGKKVTLPTTAEIKPKGKMPKDTPDGSNPAKVDYLKGVAYTVQKDKRFRGLTIRGNPYTETSSSWKTQSKADAWKVVTKAIEAA